MKVVILTEGGVVGGLGHVTRCSALLDAFAERGADAVMLADLDGVDAAGAGVVGPGRLPFEWLDDERAAIGALAGADVAVVDSYLAPPGLYAAVSRAARLAVFLDDVMRLDYPEGVVLNGAIGAESLGYPARAGVDYLLGVKYAPMRREFRGVPAREAADVIGTVLLTFGGGDDAGLTAFVSALVGARRPGAARKVIVGPGAREVGTIGRGLGPKDELIERPTASRMLDAMLSSDLAVTAGGQTMYELAAAGVPAVAVEAALNQRANVAGWVDAGFARAAGAAQDRAALAEAIIEGMAAFDGKIERARAAAAGRALADGRGAQRAVEAITGMLEKKPLKGAGARR